MDCNTIKKDYQFATLEAAKAQLAVWLAKERKDFDEHFAPSLEAHPVRD